MKRDYIFQCYGTPWSREFVESGMGDSGRLELYEVRHALAPDDACELRFTIDWNRNEEWLEEHVHRLVRGLQDTDRWTVKRSQWFVDLMFPPVPPRPDVVFIEHCIVEAPLRYGVIARYPDAYRFYVGPMDPESNMRGFIDTEDSLDICLSRTVAYLRRGEGVSAIFLSHRLGKSGRG